jgi:hypothetical protein
VLDTLDHQQRDLERVVTVVYHALGDIDYVAVTRSTERRHHRDVHLHIHTLQGQRPNERFPSSDEVAVCSLDNLKTLSSSTIAIPF